jgi:hypothetical protein
MKYLMILFFIINTSYAEECGKNSVEKVNLCVVDDLIKAFVDYEKCDWPKSVKNKDKKYSNLVCDPLIPLSFFESMLSEWKVSQLARLAEKARLKDVKDRLKAIGVKFKGHGSINGLRRYMNKCGYSHSNTAVWIKEVFKVENIAFLECMESKKAEVDQDKIDRDARKNLLKTYETNVKNHDCNTETSVYVKWKCELNKGI